MQHVRGRAQGQKEMINPTRETGGWGRERLPYKTFPNRSKDTLVSKVFLPNPFLGFAPSNTFFKIQRTL